jgi:hypothetical protein
MRSRNWAKAAIVIDAQDNLIYELAVPLRLLYRKLPALATGQKAMVGIILASGKLIVPSQGSGGGMRGSRSGYSSGQQIAPLALKTSVQLSNK